jgi:hypothetical protein
MWRIIWQSRIFRRFAELGNGNRGMEKEAKEEDEGEEREGKKMNGVDREGVRNELLC